MKTIKINRTYLKSFGSVFIMSALLIGISLMFSACGKNNTQITDEPADDKKVTNQTKDVKQETPQSTETKKEVSQDGEVKKEANENKNSKTDNTSAVAVVKLPTVQCDQCKKTLTKAFKKAVGVDEFDINIDAKTVKVKYDKSKTDLAKIENVVTAAGYDANDKKADKDAYDNLDDCCKLPKDRKN
jgi:copper chaperone CopZ